MLMVLFTFDGHLLHPVALRAKNSSQGRHCTQTHLSNTQVPHTSWVTLPVLLFHFPFPLFLLQTRQSREGCAHNFLFQFFIINRKLFFFIFLSDPKLHNSNVFISDSPKTSLITCSFPLSDDGCVVVWVQQAELSSPAVHHGSSKHTLAEVHCPKRT